MRAARPRRRPPRRGGRRLRAGPGCGAPAARHRRPGHRARLFVGHARARRAPGAGRPWPSRRHRRRRHRLRQLPAAALTTPGLTSLRQPLEQVAQDLVTAVESLLAGSSDRRQTLLQPEARHPRVEPAWATAPHHPPRRHHEEPRTPTPVALPTLCLAATTALALTACGGSGFEEEGGTSEGAGEISVLIGSSGAAETDAVEDAAAAWAEESGNTAEVIVATDLTQQLSQGFAASKPPDVFYVATDTFAEYAANGSLLPYGERAGERRRLLPEPAARRSPTRASSTARPRTSRPSAWSSTPSSWEEAGLTDADVPTTWDELRAGRRRAHHRRPGRPGARHRVPARRRLHGAGRRRAGQRGRHEADRRHARRTSRRSSTCRSMLAGRRRGRTPPTLDAGWGGEAFGKGRPP